MGAKVRRSSHIVAFVEYFFKRYVWGHGKGLEGGGTVKGGRRRRAQAARRALKESRCEYRINETDRSWSPTVT
jgi:hypothetical protein